MSESQPRSAGWSRQQLASSVLAQRRLEIGLLLLILITAAGVRLCCLDSVPPGFTHDEAGHRRDALAILHGARPIYQTVGYGREPFYDYVVAGLMKLLGTTARVLRLSAVLAGVATLLLSFAWVRLAFDIPTALAALALQAVSFWSLSTSRQALRSSLLPLLFAAAVFVFWSFYTASERSDRWHVGLIALFLGAALYTYMPARVLWIAFPAFSIYLALFHRRDFGRVWRPTLIAVSLGLLLAVPLFAYLRGHPGAEQRLDMLGAPLDALKQGDPSVVLNNAGKALAGLILPGYGDDFLAYTIPGRPVFDGLTGVLFLVGLGVCLARWRDPACAFSLLWFLLGISPSLFTGPSASTTRNVGALPVLFLFPALSVIILVRQAMARWGRRAAWVVGVGFVGLVLSTGVISAQDYFVTWGQSPDVRAAYQHTLVEMAQYLQTRGEGGDVGISSIYPRAPHDPYVFDIVLRRRDLSLHWFDARRALLLPANPTARLITPSSAALDPYFAHLPGLKTAERVALRSDDLDPFFILYDWEPNTMTAALHQRVAGAPLDLPLPVNFGDVLEFLGFDLQTPQVSPGGSVELVTLWQVTDPVSLWPEDRSNVYAELVLFTHALDGSGKVVGQEDRLDAPAWDWQTNDVIAQIHRFSVRTDLSPGPLTLEVGVYRRSDLARLPVVADGVTVGDRVLLPGLEVGGQ